MKRPRHPSPNRLTAAERRARIAAAFQRLEELPAKLARWEVTACEAGKLQGDIGPFPAALGGPPDGVVHAVTRYEDGRYHAACGASSPSLELGLAGSAPSCARCEAIDPAPTPGAPAFAVAPLIEAQHLMLPGLACGFETAADVAAWEADTADFFWRCVENWDAVQALCSQAEPALRELGMAA